MTDRPSVRRAGNRPTKPYPYYYWVVCQLCTGFCDWMTCDSCAGRKAKLCLRIRARCFKQNEVEVKSQAASALVAPVGLIFWFMQKKFVGSYLSFNVASLAYFAP